MGYGKSRYGRGTYYGHGSIAGRRPAPYIIEKMPNVDEQDVIRTACVEFIITDDYTQIIRSTIKVWIRGALVFNAGAFLRGWSASRYGVLGLGFWFWIKPDPILRWLAEEEISIRAYAKNGASRIVDDTWKFVIIERPFTFKVYPMIVDGLRKADEYSD